MLVKKYMRNAAAHVLISWNLILNIKILLNLNKKTTAAESLQNHQEKATMSGGSYTQDLTALIKSTIYYNPV